MNTRAYNKIAKGLHEAIAIARGEIEPAKMTTIERVAPAIGGGYEQSNSQASSRKAESETQELLWRNAIKRSGSDRKMD